MQQSCFVACLAQVAVRHRLAANLRCAFMLLLTQMCSVRCLQMQLLRVVNNRAVSVGDIAVVVEPVPDVVRP